MFRPNSTVFTIVAAVFAMAGTARADDQAPAPPGINEPGVQTAAPATDSASEAGTPDLPDTRPVRDKASRDKNARAADIASRSDSVSERREGDDVIREYRQNAKLRMIRIRPRNGPEQIYFDQNSDGRLDRDPLDGPVAPVYFTIYEWN